MADVSVLVINQQAQPIPNALVHIDWFDLGIPAGSDEGYTNPQGYISFAEGFAIGATGNGKVSKGASFSTFTLNYDTLFGNNISVTLQFNPGGNIRSTIKSVTGSFLNLAIVVVVALIAIVLVGMLVSPLGIGKTVVSVLPSVKEKIAEVKDKVESKAEAVKEKVEEKKS